MKEEDYTVLVKPHVCIKILFLEIFYFELFNSSLYLVGFVSTKENFKLVVSGPTLFILYSFLQFSKWLSLHWGCSTNSVL